jgi:hypothetical protein
MFNPSTFSAIFGPRSKNVEQIRQCEISLIENRHSRTSVHGRDEPERVKPALYTLILPEAIVLVISWGK